MTASRAESRRAVALALALAAGMTGCRAPAPPPPERALEPLATLAGREPDAGDRAAARLAREALALRFGRQTPALERELAELRRLARHPELAPGGGLPEGRDLERTTHIATDLVHATLDDPLRYRAVTDDFVRETLLDPTLERRLEQVVEDDPRRLARRRRNDTAVTWFADAFNAVSAPIGQSMITGFVLAPFQLSYSATHYLARQWERERFGVRQRQALVLRKEYVSRYPDAPESEAMRGHIESGQARLAELQRDELMAGAERALGAGQPRLAAIQASRALQWTPEDEDALRLRARAESAREARSSRMAASLEATPGPLPDAAAPRLAARDGASSPPAGARVALALFDPEADLFRESRALVGRPALRDEAEYIAAIGHLEQGYEDASWRRLEAVDRAGGNMARHAEALRRQPLQNLYGAFQAQKRQQGRKRWSWRLFGGWSERPRYRKIPAPVAYLIDAPLLAQTLILAPFRAVLRPAAKDTPDHHRTTAVTAYRYLERHPDGEHRRELLEWLYDYQRDRERWTAALRIADFLGDVPEDERNELVEMAGTQRLASADDLRRRDERGTIYRSVGSEFPDSEAAAEAGERARGELEELAPQHIRVSRRFLAENPALAGPRGLGLPPRYRDGEVRNGELHPEGVTLLGGRVIELAFVAESGDEDDPPAVVRQSVSAERLARVVSLLEETALRNVKLDSDDVQAPDARRDHYFERARLELTDEPDLRPTAESAFAYLGVRERYGMVRGRESLLPFDMVVRGSFEDLTLGAFPRWRKPEHTPDAFLYR